MDRDQMWMEGSTVRLQLVAPAGVLYNIELPLVALMASLDNGEIVRFTWDRTDEETGVSRSGAARLVLQDLPDPRTLCDTCGAARGLHGTGADHEFVAKAEEQPTASAKATAPLRYTDNRLPASRPSGGLPLLPPYMPPRP